MVTKANLPPGSFPPLEKGGRREAPGGIKNFDRTRAKTIRARKLRNAATDHELILWSRLKNRQLGLFRFRRQHPIGPYIVDFYCPEIRLVIELDGDQHGRASHVERDLKRDAWLVEAGVEVMRFWNHEVRGNLLGVLDAILARAIERRTEAGLNPLPKSAARFSPPPFQGGERNATEERPTTKEIWSWLEDVPDPEIPVVSVVDLGIVRNVEWQGDELVITVTPTYSGCPATAVISIEIEEAIRRCGVQKVRIKSQLSPAWTTDWIGEKARLKLKAFGIAPPAGDARCVGDLKNPVVECPHCGSTATEQVARFGSTPCKASWRCRDCLEPFDYFKSF